MFNTNYDNVKEGGGLMAKGEYECIIKEVVERTTKNGASGINLSFVVRNDVEQKYQNKYLFHTLWKRREPTEADKQVDGYSFNQLMSLSKAVGLPSGKNYPSIKALCDDLVNKVARLVVDHDEYNGQTREQVKWINESKSPKCTHVFKEKTEVKEGYAQPQDEGFATKGGAVVDAENDDDYPF